MPKGNRIYKAGKITFLLVCLFLCTACEKEKAVFEAGTESVSVDSKAAKDEEIEKEELKEIPKTKMVNINTADKTELMTLPGIGEVRAAAIIEHRQRYGEFKQIEEIMNVKGIKNGIFSKINSQICVK